MALTLDTTFKLEITPDYKNGLDLSSPRDKFTYSFLKQLTTGTGAGQADRMFHDQRTLAASGTENLDLAGSLTDSFGNTVTFVELKAIAIFAAAGNTNDVQVRREATNGVPIFSAADSGVDLGPGAVFFYLKPATGDTVTAGSGDLLEITNSAGSTSVTYDIFIFGTSA